MLKASLFAALLLLAACGEAEPPAPEPAEEPGTQPSQPAATVDPQPEETAPAPETPPDDKSAEAAVEVLRAYFEHIEAGRYDEAWTLRWKGQGDDAQSARAFAESFDKYAEYHAQVGVPGSVSGAAGSLYVEVPVQLHGRLKNGEAFASAGTITLRRSNDVPGSTPEQRQWRIYSGN